MKPAAIAASLVSMKNVGTHKSVVLTVHVPEEEALRVIDAFGWPTMAAPVPVALARLVDGTRAPAPEGAESGEGLGLPRPVAPASAIANDKRSWADLPPAQQAGIRCNEQAFGAFLAERYPDLFTAPDDTPALVVRRLCEIATRADLNTNPEARTRWHSLDLAYQLWLREPAHV